MLRGWPLSVMHSHHDRFSKLQLRSYTSLYFLLFVPGEKLLFSLDHWHVDYFDAKKHTVLLLLVFSIKECRQEQAEILRKSVL